MIKLKSLLFTVILIGLYSCNFKPKLQHSNTRTFNENDKGESKEISSITEISNDTIIACLYYKHGIIISKNGGKTWTHLAKLYIFDRVTLTDNHLLVGITCYNECSWILISNDFGEHWGIFNFNKSDFIPIDIVSNPKEQLRIKLRNHKGKTLFDSVQYRIYKLTGSSLKSGWTYVKTVKESCTIETLKDSEYEIKDWNVLLKKNGTDTINLMTLYSFSQIKEIVYSNNVLHITGDNNLAFKEWSERQCCYAQYNRISGYREFKIPGAYCSLRRSNLGNVFVTSDSGLFKEEDGKIIQLY